MLNKLLELIDEQFDVYSMLGELQEAKTDAEKISIANKVIVAMDMKEWLKLKIQKLYEESK